MYSLLFFILTVIAQKDFDWTKYFGMHILYTHRSLGNLRLYVQNHLPNVSAIKGIFPARHKIDIPNIMMIYYTRSKMTAVLFSYDKTKVSRSPKYSSFCLMYCYAINGIAVYLTSVIIHDIGYNMPVVVMSSIMIMCLLIILNIWML